MKRPILLLASLLLATQTAWGRYYDPAAGRFLTRDPGKCKDANCYRIPSAEEEAGGAPSLHQYVYARNNPLRYVDPDGTCETLPDGRVDCVSADLQHTRELNWQINQAIDQGSYGQLPGLFAERAVQSVSNQSGRFGQVFIEPYNQARLAQSAFGAGDTKEGFKRVGGIVGATLQAATIVLTFGEGIKPAGAVARDELAAAEARNPGLSAPEDVGPYAKIKDELPAGMQANHLNQNAAFRDVIPRPKGVSVGLEGNAFTDVGTPHYAYHESLEQFWDQFRERGARFQETPTLAEYGQANYEALKAAGYNEAEAAQIEDAARSQRLQYGLQDADPVPRFPGPINQVARKLAEE